MAAERQPVAFVSGLDTTGYGIVRSLGRAGVSVVALTDQNADFGRHSTYCRRFHVSPAFGNEQQVCRLLLDARSEFDCDPVLFASSDWFAELLAKHREELAPRYKFHYVSAQTLARIVDKAEMSRICQQAGVLTPATHVPRPDEDLEKSAREFACPCLVKAKRSFNFDFPAGKKNLVFDSPGDLVRFYRSHAGLLGTTIWQEIIPGGHDQIFACTVLIRQSGEVGAVFGIQKIRQYPEFGIMSYGRSQENEAVASESLRLLRLLDYRGFADMEFKRGSDGRYYFIEMNPRLPRFCSLFQDAGVNLPYLGYLDLIGQEDSPAFQGKPRPGVCWLSFSDDIGSYYHARKKRELGLWRWLRWLAAARSHAWWNWRDPRPFFAAATHLMEVIARKLIHSLGFFAQRRAGDAE